MTKREQALAAIRIAAYHNDMRAATRTFIKSRISKAAYDGAVREGRDAKASGARCSCLSCAKTGEKTDG